MDTKLKNNKKSLNWIIYLIVISIVTSLVSISIYNERVRYSKEQYLMYLEAQESMACEIIPDLAMYAEDASGKLREESIEAEVNYIKSQVELYNKGAVESADVSAEDLLRNDEEIRQSVIYNFKQYVDDILRNLKDVSNVKFYYESKDNGKIYTNTNATSRDEFKEEIETYNITNNDNEDIYIKNNVYAGIAKNLTPGDNVYSQYMDYQKALVLGKICFALLGISAVSLIFSIVMLLINTKKQTLKIKEMFFSKMYWSFYTEVKIIMTFIIIGVVGAVCDGTRRYNIWTLIEILLLSFAIYIIVLDLIKLVSSKEAGNVIKDKSFIVKILRYIKVNLIGYLIETKLVKSTFSKVIAAMIIHTIYNVLLFFCII